MFLDGWRWQTPDRTQTGVNSSSPKFPPSTSTSTTPSLGNATNQASTWSRRLHVSNTTRMTSPSRPSFSRKSRSSPKATHRRHPQHHPRSQLPRPSSNRKSFGLESTTTRDFVHFRNPTTQEYLWHS